MSRKRKRRPRQAVVMEDPPRSGHYRVVDDGGWLDDDREYSEKELRLCQDALDFDYGERPGGWIREVKAGDSDQEPPA